MLGKKTKQKQTFRSLRVTLSVTFLIFNFVILLLTISLGAYFNYLIEKDLIANQENLIAREAAHTVENYIEDKFDLLKTTALLGNLLSLEEAKQTSALTKTLAADPSFRQLILFDVAGQEISRVSRTSETASKKVNAQLKINEILAQTKNQNKEYFSPVYIYETTSEPMMIIAVPLHDVFKDFSGILLAEVNLKFMWDAVDRIDPGKGGTAYVVDRQGKLIAFKDVSRVLKNENLLAIDEVREFNQNENSTDPNSAKFSKGINGTYVTATHAPLQQPDWAVVVETPITVSYGAIFNLLFFELLLTILGMIFIWFGGGYLSKKITKPIIILRDAAVKISEGDLNAKIDIKSQNEIGQLALAFNDMAYKLKNTYSVLEKKVAERTADLEKERGSLEKKVAERTADLEKERGSLEKKVAERTADLEKERGSLEKKVAERTLELEKAKANLEKTVSERTIELESKLAELKKINSLMINRELKMTELKKQIDEINKKS